MGLPEPLFYAILERHSKRKMQSYTQALHELQEMRQKWRDQYFHLDPEDAEHFEMLKQVRRERVKQFYEEGKVAPSTMQSRY